MKKRMLVFVVAIIISTAAIFTGCGKKDEILGVIDGHKYPETLTLRMISRDLHHKNGTAIGDDAVVKFFEEKFNVKFEFIYAPSPSQTEVFEKINMMIVTNDLPDIIEARTDKTLADDVYESLYSNDLIINSKEYVNENSEKYPNLSALLNDSEVNTNTFTTDDGELAMIPRYFGTIDHGFILRKDWIDEYNNGIVPETNTEFEQMLQNFKNAKPDGIDQIGLVLPSKWWLKHIYAGFTGENIWGVDDDGKYEYSATTDGQKQAYEWLNNLYSKGLLDNSIFSRTDESGAISEMVAGRTGAVMMGVTYGAPLLYEQMKTNYPEIEFAYVNISGPEAKMRQYSPEYFEGLVVRKDYKDVARIYDMIEFILSPEGDKIMQYGIEGVHYTMDGDTIVVDEEQREKENWLSRRHGLSSMFNVSVVLDKNFTSDYADIQQFIDELNEDGNMIKNPLLGVTTQTQEEYGTKVSDKQGLYEMGFINGKYSVSSKWSQYIYEMQQAGLTSIVNEINSLYSPS